MLNILEKKKHKLPLSKEEIDFFVRGVTDGSIPDYQISALLMAIRLCGMDARETADLTLAMAASGGRCDLSSLPGRKVDKHSTGGVGDTTTLILLPLVAACGVVVAKMSGRSLGHTGGTVDKLGAIKGFQTEISQSGFLEILKSCGAAVVGQSSDLAPADKVLYHLRDVTATVDSLPLIAASILSKKLAAGCDAIVLDVKTGTGALMQTLEESIALAQTMVDIGKHAGVHTIALVTDMNQPLGSHVGNALEVKEALMVLCGEVQGALKDVSLLVGAKMLLCAGRCATQEEALALLEDALSSGAGLRKFEEIIYAQGGDASVVQDTSLLPTAAYQEEVSAAQSGFVGSMRADEIGRAAQVLGAGRHTAEDTIDLAVGLVLHVRVGDAIKKGQSIATLHYNNRKTVHAAKELLLASIAIQNEPATPPPLCYAVVE